ncbi:thiol reductant ABC exporter subunit CydC [Alkalicaulis satelles]|uniref:Thiol reductant ABC exporter subunit CydC n=1 Tax=Alkalicaulis satelles TaxID=2609175 RepID=A0A5M6ZEM3_9PROT|nr:thiol reductant ABC exporter subunit CydC [Alkalicaulis satelles]KAA5802257.1 thiol reductant ABC exporter subunit CydC [Alkalicaulis satelles]
MKDLLFFLSLARQDRWRLALGAALAAASAVTGLALMALAGWVAAAAGAGTVLVMGALIGGGGLRLLALMRPVLRYSERMASHDAAFRALARLRLWVFDAAAPLAPGPLTALRSGDLLARVTRDVDALDALYMRMTTTLAAALAALIAAAVLLALTAPAALPAVLGLYILTALVLPAAAARCSAAPGARAVSASALARAEAADLVSGLADLKAGGADARVIARLDSASVNWVGAQRQLNASARRHGAILSLAGPLILIAGFAAAHAGGAPPALAALAGFAGFALFETALPLVQAGEQYGQTRTAAGRLRALSATAPAIASAVRPAPAPASHDLAFEGVRFTYPGADKPALNGLDLTLPEGARLAVTGASGAGKSSLIRLALAFYAPDAGAVRLGGAPVPTLDPGDVRSRLALAGQRAELLSGTVAENLRLARPDANEAALWDALALARADKFVRELPDGLDTWIGEQGGLISGGQARRLVLARAYLRDAPVLLLDEPSEGLDADTEADIAESLAVWLDADPRRSALIITHRPRLLALAHEAVVMEEGRVIERGAPEALSARGGAFARLFPDYSSEAL